MSSALNTWGYYIETDIDRTVPNFLATQNNSLGRPIVKTRFRPRLMEFRQPTEAMSLYDADNANPTRDWYATALKSASTAGNADYSGADPTVRVLAENIVALIIVPKLSKNDEDNLRQQQVTLTPPPAWQLCPWYIYDSTLTANPGMTGTAPGVNTATVNPKNQLPPVIQVTMVALDERSAKTLDERYGTGVNNTNAGSTYMGLDIAGTKCTPAVNFTTLFTNQAKDTLASKGDGTNLEGPLGDPSVVAASDLNSLQQILIHEKLTYRVFTSNVTVRAAKWSRVQSQ
jgi:uncharacterized protein (TIGR02599 family)